MKVVIMDSVKPGKKMTAVFYKDNKKIKTVHFGQEGADDFTITKDLEQKERYIQRHKKNEDWSNPMSRGSLARYILWNKPTISESIKAFKSRFYLS